MNNFNIIFRTKSYNYNMYMCFLICFKRFKKLFGKRVTGAICGGGSMQRDTSSFFYSIRVPLLDCYGMTETAPFLALGNPRRLRAGCVGKVFPSAQLKVVAQKDGVPLSGEPLKPGKKGILFAKGRQVMKGYYRRPDLTQKAIDKDGWINTGDYAILSPKNEVTIAGRAKDTIVLLGGENIEPQIIENAICRSKFVESAVVVGQDKKYIAALIVPYKDDNKLRGRKPRLLRHLRKPLERQRNLQLDSRRNRQFG